ncbi:alpha/beta fold hydrolase [Roseibium sp. MMSF_3544]|uniref:alpha/beta fold hydrolase n=1 Tax=unclassified Roseibium TaxID=2629323 RepID=UPI00274002C7|nr:alpha/beta fold hydrolase [Roseibium sp. MMSF_3544]
MQIMERWHETSHTPHPRYDTLQVMALHCSGSDNTQWEHLPRWLSSDVFVMRPNLAGPEAAAAGWSMSTYSLEEEAKPLIDQLNKVSDPVHLVGHSYGAAVALHIAQNHPDLVASLCLYEPTSFSLLNGAIPEDAALFDDIRKLATSVHNAIEEGYPDFAAQVFTDFWGGLGAWQVLRRDRRAALTDWISKCPLDFGALLYEPDEAFQKVQHPTTLIIGSQTHRQTKRIGELLKSKLPDARLIEVEGVGHLGPFIFRDKVADLVEEHLNEMTSSDILRQTI